MIHLTEENLKELETFINDIPTKYGLPLLNFFSKLAQEQQPTEEQPLVEEAE